jgi:hypothetical protein
MLDVILSQPFDLDLGLKEVRDDNGQQPSRRVLASLSVGMPAGDAFFAARELQNAVELIVSGSRRGRVKLAEILGARGDDYQRALWYSVSGRDHFGVLSDLGWLVELLDARLKIAVEMNGKGVDVTMDPSSYACDGPRGPFGEFSSEFDVAAFDLLSTGEPED